MKQELLNNELIKQLSHFLGPHLQAFCWRSENKKQVLELTVDGKFLQEDFTDRELKDYARIQERLKSILERTSNAAQMNSMEGVKGQLNLP
jgi:hypothetical protein